MCTIYTVKTQNNAEEVQEELNRYTVFLSHKAQYC